MNTSSGLTRPDWTQWALGLAKAVAARADCSRRQVGAVILDDEHRVLSVGYNGAAPGGLSCLAGQCPRGLSDVAPGSSYDTGAGSCISIHAEANALLFSDPIRRRGGLIAITDEPCGGCERLLLGSGLARCITPAGERLLR